MVSQLTMFYKIRYRQVIIYMQQLIPTATLISKHEHHLKYAIPVATMDGYKFSLYPRSIELWNQLPSTAASPVAFHALALPTVVVMKLRIGSRMQ